MAASTIIEKFFQRQLCKEGLQSILDKKNEVCYVQRNCVDGFSMFRRGSFIWGGEGYIQNIIIDEAQVFYFKNGCFSRRGVRSVQNIADDKEEVCYILYGAPLRIGFR